MSPEEANRGINANSGITAMSCSNRMPKAARPYGAVSCFFSASICRPIAVDESDSTTETSRPSLMLSSHHAANGHSSSVDSSICSVPLTKISRRSTRRRFGLSSSPMTNNSRTMPSSEKWRMVSTSSTRPSTQGPTITPAAR